MRTTISNAAKGAVLFGLLGPAIGLLVAVLPDVVATGNSWSFRGLLALVPGAYFVGVLPALACGLIAGVFRSRLPRVTGALVAGVLGALCSAGYYVLLSGNADVDRTAFLFVVAGLVSGLGCGAVFFSNNSLKPKPLRSPAHSRR